MPIRLPNIPGVQPAAINAPQMDARAAAAPALALGNLAQSIAQGGEAFHTTAINIQRVENARAVSKARQDLADAYSRYQIELQADPDPASRIRKTEQFFAGYRGTIDSPDLPPAVRDELFSHFDHFATTETINSRVDAHRLAMKRASATFQNEFETAATRSQAEAAARAASSAGILLPEEEARALREWDRKQTIEGIRREIHADPITMERLLAEDGFEQQHAGLEFDQLISLRGEAERMANRERGDFFNDLIIAGEEPTPDELKELEAAGFISKDTHARMLANKQTPAPAHDPALYEETYSQILEYQPQADPSGRIEARLREWIASQPLPKEDIRKLNDKLGERLNPGDAPKNTHESEFAAKIRADFNRGDFGKYRFPVDHDDNPASAPIFPVNAAAYDAAYRARGQFAESWRAELSRLPADAPFDQVEQTYQKLKKSFKERSPTPALNLTRPAAPLPFDPETTYRQSAPRATFGGQPVKPPGGVYLNASATVFGGPNDPADNGQSALGGKTGAGGREGAAIPKPLLDVKFPGKDKKWIDANVRVVTRAPNGSMRVLPIADFGTAEWVWQRAGRPTLDLTEGAARDLGGTPKYDKAGKLRGLSGLDNLEFAVVSTDTGDFALKGSTWTDAKAAWFKANNPRNLPAADMGLIALREAWNAANADDPAVLPLPDIPATAPDSLLPPR